MCDERSFQKFEHAATLQTERFDDLVDPLRRQSTSAMPGLSAAFFPRRRFGEGLGSVERIRRSRSGTLRRVAVELIVEFLDPRFQLADPRQGGIEFAPQAKAFGAFGDGERFGSIHECPIYDVAAERQAVGRRPKQN